MLQPGGRARFAEEASAGGFVAREIAGHHLDRDLAVEDGVFAAVEDTHPAAAHALRDLVPAEGSRNVHGISCYRASALPSRTSRNGPMATGTPTRSTTRSIRCASTHVPFWLFKSINT